MSRYSADHKSQTRQRILVAADRLMKEKGVEVASVEAVMRDAGLTVGGFYAHFPSKEVLAREALLFGLEASVDRLLMRLATIADRAQRVRALIRLYLAQADEASLAHACPMTLLLPEVARGGREWQNAFAQRTGALLERIAEHFPEVPGMTRREAALMVYTSCVGAVAVARALPAPDARHRVMRATERMLLRSLGIADDVEVEGGMAPVLPANVSG